MSNSDQGSIIIFLVHGTFARSAKWTQSGSIFRSRMRDELNTYGYNKIKFEIVEWSAGNSHDARREGAIKLKERVSQSIEKQPDALHYIVAHSHGGNIALSAMGHSDFNISQRCGVVTLATPFLKFWKKNISLFIWPLLIWGFIKDYRSLIAFQYQLSCKILSSLFNIKNFSGPAFLFGFILILVMTGWIYLSIPLIKTIGPTPGHWIAGLCSIGLTETVCNSVGFMVNLVSLLLGLFFLIFVLFEGSLNKINWTRLRALARLRQKIFRRYTYSQPEKKYQIPILSMSSVIDEALGVLSGAWLFHRWISWMARTVTLIMLLGSVFLAIF